MDLGRFSVCFMICLIGTTNPSSNEKCLCSKIPEKINTKNPLETCSGTSDRFRYVCIKDYVRKAGSSNLLKCKDGEWISSTLECIRNPSLTTAKPSTTTQLPNSPETSPGLQNESSSESTDSGGNKKPSSPGTMESTTAQYTPQSSKHSTVSTMETILSQMDRHKSMVTEVGIGVTVVILTGSAISLILFFIYRRRNFHIPTPSEAEMEPMNGAPAKVP